MWSLTGTVKLKRVVTQIFHEYGGQEKCPWTRPIMEGMAMFCCIPLRTVYLQARQ